MRTRINKKRLQLILGVFFITLALPTTILIYQAISQLKWETYRQHQQQAQELTQRIDRQFQQLIQKEQARAFSEYSFLNVAGDVSANIVQRSPLAQFPINSDIPGVVGYFQVDNQGHVTTPLLPPGDTTNYGIPTTEAQQRQSLYKQVHNILARNQLVTERQELGLTLSKREARKQKVLKDEYIPADAMEQGASVDLSMAEGEAMADGVTTYAQQAFDLLNTAVESASTDDRKKSQGSLGSVEELQIAPQRMLDKDSPVPQKAAVAEAYSPSAPISARKEQTFLPEAVVDTLSPATIEEDKALNESLRITTFESEVDPFNFSILDSGHFVMFRKVWRNGQRYTQGILIDQQALLAGIIESAYQSTSLYSMSSLVVAYQGEVFAAFTGTQQHTRYSRAAQLQGELLYKARLSTPMADMQLIYSVTQLPLGPGATVVIWASIAIGLILIGGFTFIYYLGNKQIALNQQQQDFVSAVSHELKTPLTSIRMYGEMLREGWTTEEKRKAYYNYIYDESERLSRLINNVLQLARMNRNDLQLNIRPTTLAEINDTIRSKISSQLERSEFTLTLLNAVTLDLDLDAFTQIIINLVDNAIKFSRNAEKKHIDIHCKQLSNNTIEFSVRDYGPGIAKGQMKKIFKLFYRSENELTRETVGTGIGLALVHQLVTTMNGTIDVVNENPGATFRLIFRI